jgi:hypothetical protein
MPGLWRFAEGTREGKYLVKRRDGTVPEWPWFVLGAKDPAAPWALRVYAVAALICGMDWQYVKDTWRLAGQFAGYRRCFGHGDPDARKHRLDDATTVAEMAKGPLI